MPTAKSHRRGQEEKDRKGRLTEKASSIQGRIPETVTGSLHRPWTVPVIFSGQSVAGEVPRPKLTKLLLNVTVQRSLGPVMVLLQSILLSMYRSGAVMAWNVFKFCTALRGLGSIMILLVLGVRE